MEGTRAVYGGVLVVARTHMKENMHNSKNIWRRANFLVMDRSGNGRRTRWRYVNKHSSTLTKTLSVFCRPSQYSLRDTVAAKTREPPRVSLGAVQCGTAMTTVRSNQDN